MAEYTATKEAEKKEETKAAVQAPPKLDPAVAGLQKQLAGYKTREDKNTADLNAVKRDLADLQRVDLDPEERQRLTRLDQEKEAFEAEKTELARIKDSMQVDWINFEASKLVTAHRVPLETLLLPDDEGNPPTRQLMRSRALEAENVSLKARLNGGGEKQEKAEEENEPVYDAGSGAELPAEKSILRMSKKEYAQIQKNKGVKGPWDYYLK